MKRDEINKNSTDSLEGLAIIQIVNKMDAFLRGLQTRLFSSSISLPKNRITLLMKGFEAEIMNSYATFESDFVRNFHFYDIDYSIYSVCWGLFSLEGKGVTSFLNFGS